MNIIPKSPASAPATPTVASPSAQSARERAIAALSTQAQSHPVSNPTSVAPEEMAAITPSQSHNDSSETPATPEPPKEATEASKSEEPALSSQYAQLARKERAMRAKAQAMEASIKAKEAAIAEREAAIKAKEAEYSTNYVPKERISQDPWTVLTEAGLTYDQLTELALNQKAQDPATKAALAKLEGQIKAAQESQECTVKAMEAAQAQQYQQALQQIRNDATNLVKSDPDAYEAIAATDSVEDVVELIKETFQKDGQLLTVEEAAQAVEEYLAEEAYKLANLRKIQNKLRPAAPAATQPQKQPDPSPAKSPPTKTLNNSMGSSRQLSAKERAILAFKGELKS